MNLDGTAVNGKPVSGIKLTVRELGARWARWMVNPAVGRACVEVLIAGVAYLL